MERSIMQIEIDYYDHNYNDIIVHQKMGKSDTERVLD